MNSTQFQPLAGQLMLHIENTLDRVNESTAANHLTIDCENDGNVLTLTFNDHSKIIINRQTALQQIWLATRTAGYHFSYQNHDWLCQRTGAPLLVVLSEACTQQAGSAITFL